MEWLILLMLILIGVILVVLEFLVFPGVNVVGLIGFVCIIAGVYLGYDFYGSTIGHFVLLGTALGCGAVTWYILRTNTWKRLSLNTSIDSTVEGIDSSIHVGDLGITVGRLAPMGEVRIGDLLIEAESQTGYINAHSEIVVVKVMRTKIIVQLNNA